MTEEKTIPAAEEEETTGYYHHVFKKPFTYNGNTYATLDFDFESLTGRDMTNALNELSAKRVIVAVPDINPSYQMALAAKACKEKIGTDAFDYMSIKDCSRIRGAVQAFLLDAE